jgi:hypothetical protein
LLNEIAEIVAIDPDREVPFDKDEVLQEPLDILDICSSLVTDTVLSNEQFDSEVQVTMSKRNIALAHYPVQEYLTSERCISGRASQYAMNERACHMLILESCLSSLLHHTDEHDLDTSVIELTQYSARYWITHANNGSLLACWSNRTIMVLSNSIASSNWIRIHDPDRSWPSLEERR